MRLAYVLPRYGPEVPGGAETLAREVIKQMTQRGHHVEVWTTCIRNIYTWANEYPAGVVQSDGIIVRRFPVEIAQSHDILAEPLSRENQYHWVDSLPHSPELYAHIAAHGTLFDFLIFVPYIMGITFHGATIYPKKSIIWACLHDELTAYLAPTRDLLANATGIIFNTESEEALMTQKLRIRHPRTIVAGMGFNIPAGNATTFRQKYPYLEGHFFIYAGRLDSSKNVDLLLRYFVQYRSRHNGELKLVLLGNGPLSKQNLNGVFSLGFLEEATKRDALAAATFLCQPSRYESFSIVLMEAWAQGRPVLVHEHCGVTVTHTRQAQGGLYFANYHDFEAVVDYFLTHPVQADQMGANGKAYVRQNYNWSVIINRLEQALQSWLEQLR